MEKILYSEIKLIKLDDLAIHKDNFFRDVDRESQKEFDADVAAQGVQDPIVLTKEKNANGQYEILNGARRFRASKKAGFKTIPAKHVLSELTDIVRARVMVAQNGFAKDYTPENRKRVILIWFGKDEVLQDDRGGSYGNKFSSRKEFKTPIRRKIMDMFGWPLGTVNRDLKELRDELKKDMKKPPKELPELKDGEIRYFNNRILDWWEAEKQKMKVKADLRKEIDSYKERLNKISKKQSEHKKDFGKVGGFDHYLKYAIQKDPDIKKLKDLKKFVEEREAKTN